MCCELSLVQSRVLHWGQLPNSSSPAFFYLKLLQQDCSLQGTQVLYPCCVYRYGHLSPVVCATSLALWKSLPSSLVNQCWIPSRVLLFLVFCFIFCNFSYSQSKKIVNEKSQETKLVGFKLHAVLSIIMKFLASYTIQTWV